MAIISALAQGRVTSGPRAPLHQPILVATDGTAQSTGAFAAAVSIAAQRTARAEGAGEVAVHVVTVCGTLPVLSPEMATVLPGDLVEIARADMLAAATEQVRFHVADATGWQVDATSGAPASAIVDLAVEDDASLIVMGLGKHDIVARVFGSETALMVMQQSHVPVLAVPQNWIGIPHRLLIAVDFGPAGLRAARAAMGIVASGGTVCFSHVAPELGMPGHNEQVRAIHQANLHEELDRFIAAVGVPADVTVTRAALYGATAPTLLDYARANAIDMIVAGTHGMNAFARLLVGSVASRLVRGAQCAVLVASAAEDGA